ncbi:ADP-ribose pyrophosphatase [Geodia barretti]|uniref:ADP-ribose pyrophosphatase n=1 Tax=Geodia barretti TaxID=519541 RepID=A0AA35W273_GEOBA|nr:ADP-ribose pyrophosphatase [Geodia barretti]
MRPVCPSCGKIVYYDPKVAAVTIIARDGKVLLVRRANEPGYGLWSVPGGYVDRGEVVEKAAAREVFEETGLRVVIDHLIGLFSEEGRTVIVAAFSGLEQGGQLKAGSEALDVGFFGLDSLPPLAFPGDARMLESWVNARDKSP